MFNWKCIFGQSQHQTLFECRRCGKTVESDAEVCPECGADDIVRYEF
ncbi:zinc ribbon domain-containing protein [Natrinema zhouii]